MVRAEKGHQLPPVDAGALEHQLATAVRSWDEDLAANAVRLLGEPGRDLLDMCSTKIPETYKTDVSAADATDDLSTILDLRRVGGGVRVSGWWRARTGGP